MNHAERYINERYVDVLCRDTGMTRDQAVAALRRVLQAPDGASPGPRPHNPTRVLIALGLFGAAWTVAAAAAVALIWGWRP